MLEKCSKKMTAHFIRKNSIKEEEREVYDYCFEIMLSTLLNLTALIIIGIATAKYIETLVFSVVFMSMRGAGGGYHANTHWGCFLTLMVIFGSMVGLTYLPSFVTSIMSIALMTIAALCSIILAPVDCDNKPIDAEDSKRLKRKLMLIILAIIVVYVILMLFAVTRIFAFALSFAAFAVSMMYAMGAIKNKMHRHDGKDI